MTNTQEETYHNDVELLFTVVVLGVREYYRGGVIDAW